ncbi:MAG TPA: DUF2267 domain-containing protein [Minicystis sp.]|nr:DUF2267 domain-containing protein [Minicystis sp.]
MDAATFLEHVGERAALDDLGRALDVTTATLHALSDALTPDEAARCARALPRSLAGALVGRAPPSVRSIAALVAEVAAAAHERDGVAREHAEAVCDVVAEALDAETRALVVRRLGPELGRLFTWRGDEASFERPPPHGPRRTNLAEGRPGSAHPISEAAPVVAHAHSVARNADPHAETKLSSSAGMTQERMRESLAVGAPGPKRSISSA